jgi:AcrR family transcriptional regulator
MTGAHTQIPSGRRGEGGLTKDEVASIQRSRILFAMAEAVADQGYPSVSVADVVGRAGVSRATFYEMFTDKQDCFLAAFDTAVGLLFGDLVVPAERGPAGFSAVLASYLDSIAANEAFARVFLIDIHAVPEGAHRRADNQATIAGMIANMFGVADERRLFACEALVAAIATLVTARLAAGDLEGIRALHAPLVRLAEDLLV